MTCRGCFNLPLHPARRLRRTCLPFVFLVLAGLLPAGCRSSDGAGRTAADVPRIMPVVLRTIPHDTTAFTQGFLYTDGKLYESTGLHGASSLRRIDPRDGVVEIKIPVPGMFAEGLAFSGATLVQLTWQDGVALVYSYPGLNRTGFFRYHGEGWGLVWDGAGYIMSNGSDTLYWRDEQFRIRKKAAVTLRGKPLYKLNELEYARGRIFANVWFNDFICEIDPASGRVVRVIDCTPLIRRIGVITEENVLNGIAYNRDTDTFYLTGKNWPLIFEVTIAR